MREGGELRDCSSKRIRMNGEKMRGNRDSPASLTTPLYNTNIRIITILIISNASSFVFIVLLANYYKRDSMEFNLTESMNLLHRMVM